MLQNVTISLSILVLFALLKIKLKVLIFWVLLKFFINSTIQECQWGGKSASISNFIFSCRITDITKYEENLGFWETQTLGGCSLGVLL